MKTYKILWTRQEYGTLILKAENEQQAREMFDVGNYDEKDLNIKNGGMELEEINEVDELIDLKTDLTEVKALEDKLSTDSEWNNQ